MEMEKEEQLKILLAAIDETKLAPSSKATIKKIADLFVTKVKTFDPHLFLENIQTLEIKINADLKVKANYDCISNVITLRDNGVENLYSNGLLHEVLHMASTDRANIVRGVKNEKGEFDYVCGLHIVNDGCDYLVGFNEGVTALLEHQALRDTQIGYPFEYRVAHIVEEMVGRFAGVYFTGQFGEEDIDKIITETKDSYGAWFLELVTKLDIYNADVLLNGKIPTRRRVQMIFEIQNIVFDMFETKVKRLLSQGKTNFIKFAEGVLATIETHFFTVKSSQGAQYDWQKDVFAVAPVGEIKKFQARVDAMRKVLK